MKPKKILTVIGTRPQFIKASAISAVLAACGALREVAVHTGQHFDPHMADVFFFNCKGVGSIARPCHVIR